MLLHVCKYCPIHSPVIRLQIRQFGVMANVNLPRIAVEFKGLIRATHVHFCP